MMIWEIYNTLIADDAINILVGNRIKFYEYPEPNDVKETHIIIDPISAPVPAVFADDNWLTEDYMFQIDVWSKNMNEVHELASKIRSLMWNLSFRQTDGMDEYDNDYDVYRDARRYRGKAYRKDLNKL